MRFLVSLQGIEIRCDRPGEVRVGVIDPGIDHRDKYPAAGRQAVGLDELDLLRRVLIRIPRRGRILRQRVEIVRLRPRDRPFADQPANHRCDRGGAAKTPSMQGAPGQANADGFDARHRVT